MAWTLRRFAGRELVRVDLVRHGGLRADRHGGAPRRAGPGDLPRHDVPLPRDLRAARPDGRALSRTSGSRTGAPRSRPRPRPSGYGPELWRRDPDRCCALRKVEPMRQALAGRGRLDHRPHAEPGRRARGAPRASSGTGRYRLRQGEPARRLGPAPGVGLRARARRALQRAARARLPDARLHPLHRAGARRRPARLHPQPGAGRAPTRPSAGCTSTLTRHLARKA